MLIERLSVAFLETKEDCFFLDLHIGLVRFSVMGGWIFVKLIGILLSIPLLKTNMLLFLPIWLDLKTNMNFSVFFIWNDDIK